jgi:hypothetical protein
MGIMANRRCNKVVITSSRRWDMDRKGVMDHKEGMDRKEDIIMVGMGRGMGRRGSIWIIEGEAVAASWRPC